MKKYKCCICGKEFELKPNNYNNPEPLGKNNKDFCCNNCNEYYVINARTYFDKEIRIVKCKDESCNDNWYLACDKVRQRHGGKDKMLKEMKNAGLIQ